MKCPHCEVEVHPEFSTTSIQRLEPISVENGEGYGFNVLHMTCPACRKAIFLLDKLVSHSGWRESRNLIYPHQMNRRPAAVEVPKEIADDFNEAVLVVGLSPKASAALSRRCLQALLRLQGFTQHDLAKAIDAVIAGKTLPASLSENLDAIRNIGNFAAHPLKETQTGTILEVEDHEAEWNLDVLEGLFDFFYVQPAKDAARKAALNAKLQAAGKPPMKG